MGYVFMFLKVLAGLNPAYAIGICTVFITIPVMTLYFLLGFAYKSLINNSAYVDIITKELSRKVDTALQHAISNGDSNVIQSLIEISNSLKITDQ